MILRNRAATQAIEEISFSEDPDAEAYRVRWWRHKIQKAFLSPEHGITEEALPEMDTIFTTIEEYDGMTTRSLIASKIGVVLRHLVKLDPDKVPGNATYRFQERARVLREQWVAVLELEAFAKEYWVFV
ncbi:hypothetical protein BDN72DRAFT_849319 [Pluteus cervinus]|uniref:Uncharacterized protein n=1 Tax=Pluteus cervinus TaxID=181527 RepID=A0ACD3A951_9AGAR|nr:hypothetical protein BDN72DRAFT_849319 [Pluteus cervinus]